LLRSFRPRLIGGAAPWATAFPLMVATLALTFTILELRPAPVPIGLAHWDSFAMSADDWPPQSLPAGTDNELLATPTCAGPSAAVRTTLRRCDSPS
jgi:hypothetical protein